MPKDDYIDTYENSFHKRLYENLPTGYAVEQLVNADTEEVKTMSAPYLKQSTVILDRINSSAGGLTSRTEFIHNIQILVNKDKGSEKRGITSTAKELIALFENKYFDGLYCQEATPEKVGDEPNTNLYRYDVNVNGYFEGN